MGVTEAVLKVDGTMPNCRDELIMSNMRGHGAGREDFTRHCIKSGIFGPVSARKSP